MDCRPRRSSEHSSGAAGRSRFPSAVSPALSISTCPSTLCAFSSSRRLGGRYMPM